MSKAIRKHIADNGFKSLYGHCTEFQYLVKLILALTYVPEAKVQVAFDTVVQAQYKRLQEEDIYDDYEVQLIIFMAYITRTSNWTWLRATEKEAHVPNPELEQSRGCHYGQTSDKQCGGDIQRQLDRHHGAHSKLV